MADEKAEKGAEPTYSRERLIAESDDLAGCEGHVMAGALHSQDERRSNFTVAEAKKAVSDFLKREVK